ncbi:MULTISPECIES: hypothetical protein [Nocardia]|uniref:Transposase n=1 Tax=Nocardia thailandica TaxID=257275 RepID=A0ABW6PXY5_9NOCA|nr:hypothetical protein [Nocardia asteroides]UGT50777.1 hypothetical protein LT345_09635 [Nocardia asteroides]
MADDPGVDRDTYTGFAGSADPARIGQIEIGHSKPLPKDDERRTRKPDAA